MSSQAELEQRVASLEREVAGLKSRLNGSSKDGGWVDEVSGRFKGSEAFREILRLGKELRDAESEEND
jgi:hypothetical protein